MSSCFCFEPYLYCWNLCVFTLCCTGAPNFQQGYIHHGGQTTVQTTFPGSVAPTAAMQPNQTLNPVSTENFPTVNAKAQEALSRPVDEDFPPSYNSAAPY